MNEELIDRLRKQADDWTDCECWEGRQKELVQELGAITAANLEIDRLTQGRWLLVDDLERTRNDLEATSRCLGDANEISGALEEEIARLKREVWEGREQYKMIAQSRWRTEDKLVEAEKRIAELEARIEEELGERWSRSSCVSVGVG